MAIGIGAGVAMMKSAVYQGETSAACINLTARRPEQGGKAILMPALVETYAVVALLAAILVSIWLTPDKGMKYHPDKNKPAVAEVKADADKK
jgi:V/A-type H+-transporting ATPase subunit K